MADTLTMGLDDVIGRMDPDLADVLRGRMKKIRGKNRRTAALEAIQKVRSSGVSGLFSDIVETYDEAIAEALAG